MDYKKTLEGPIPNHVALILDGNGRWAKEKGKPRTYGHLHGGLNIRKSAIVARELGINYLTCYCFSTENWSRPSKEIQYLFTKPIRFFKRYRKTFFDLKIKVEFIGRRDRFTPEFLRLMNEMEDESKDFTGLTLVLAVDYGSRDEITKATKQIAKDCLDGKITLDQVTEDTINDNLYTKNYPDVDLLIRTSGEERLSNYLLWQCAYAELVFTKTYWPAFDRDEFFKSINVFQNRNRRFGGLE